MEKAITATMNKTTAALAIRPTRNRRLMALGSARSTRLRGSRLARLRARFDVLLWTGAGRPLASPSCCGCPALQPDTTGWTGRAEQCCSARPALRRSLHAGAVPVEEAIHPGLEALDALGQPV